MNYDKVENNTAPIDIPKPTSSAVDEALKTQQKPQEPEKKEPVAKAEVKAPTFWEKTKESATTSAKNGWKNIIVPNIKAATLEFLYQELRNIIYQGNPPATSSHFSSGGSSGGTIVQAAVSKFAYDSVSKLKTKEPDNSAQYSRIVGGNAKVPTLMFKTEQDIMDVYNSVSACMETYHWVSVRDLYEYSDLSSMISGADEKYGWRSMDGIRTVHDEEKGRWYLVMPQCVKFSG